MSLYSPNIPRCQHIKINGTQCGSPALRRNKFCFFHKKWRETRIALNANRARRARAALELPVLEDANSIQISLMQVMRLIVSGQIDPKTAGLLLYALQTASSNLGRTSFEPRPMQVVIDPKCVDQSCLGENLWENEDFDDEEEVDPEFTDQPQKPDRYMPEEEEEEEREPRSIAEALLMRTT